MSFDDVIKSEINLERQGIQVRNFEFRDCPIKFIYIFSRTVKENPSWLDFINERLEESDNHLSFNTVSERASGILLIGISERVLVATFGLSGESYLAKENFETDFGIKTAMNMCGNQEIRQTKSFNQAMTNQYIDRQVTAPSDSFSFGLSESELLRYISAHVKEKTGVTLQGKDNLTIKVIGDEKLTWDRLLDYCQDFLEEYGKTTYKQAFPNYLNFQEVDKEGCEALDAILIEKLRQKDFSEVGLTIPTFIADDEYSFSYTNYPQRENIIFSFLDISQLGTASLLNLEEVEIEELRRRYIYAYSHELGDVLGYKKWSIYECLVYEIKDDEACYILASGKWVKVEDDFYNGIRNFIEESIPVEDVPPNHHNIPIFSKDLKKNSESVFNKKVCEINTNAILFDQAKLQIGTGRKDKEFCDILEISDGFPMNIIHVKQYSGASAINYLFSQSKFYCDAFMRDDVFLKEIRKHISNSTHTRKVDFLDHIKEKTQDLLGNQYKVRLWFLYDKSKPCPTKSSIPLMAQYELKLTYEHLRKVNKYSDISLSFIPVEISPFSRKKANRSATGAHP